MMEVVTNTNVKIPAFTKEEGFIFLRLMNDNDLVGIGNGKQC